MPKSHGLKRMADVQDDVSWNVKKLAEAMAFYYNETSKVDLVGWQDVYWDMGFLINEETDKLWEN